jgi:hypothetical protein
MMVRVQRDQLKEWSSLTVNIVKISVVLICGYYVHIQREFVTSGLVTSNLYGITTLMNIKLWVSSRSGTWLRYSYWQNLLHPKAGFFFLFQTYSKTEPLHICKSRYFSLEYSPEDPFFTWASCNVSMTVAMNVCALYRPTMFTMIVSWLWADRELTVSWQCATVILITVVWIKLTCSVIRIFVIRLNWCITNLLNR